MRYLCIDYGDKRTGLAISDSGHKMASPLCVISDKSLLINKIISIIEEEHVDSVVVGMPFNMDNTEGPQAKKVRKFTELLSKQVEIPIVFYDERLSSFDAENKLSGVDLTRKGKKKRLDAVAAASILQSFLDEKSLENQNNYDS